MRTWLLSGAATAALAAALLVGASGCAPFGRKKATARAIVNCRQMCQQGQGAIDRGDWTAAEAMLAEAVETCPVDAQARRLYADALWRSGHRSAAVAEIDEAVRLAADDAELLVRAAEMRSELGQLDAALGQVTRALELDPKSPRAWSAAGDVRRQLGQVDEALAAYHRAVSYDPSQSEPLRKLAELFAQVGRPERALVNLQSLVDLYPPGEEPTAVLALMADTLAALGRYDDAVDRYQRVVARGDTTPALLAALGEAELRAGRPQAAQSAARRALSLEPGHRGSLDLLRRCEVALGGPHVPTNR